MSLTSTENILQLLFSYNPWWQTGAVQKNFDRPMKRFAYYEVMRTIMHTDIRRMAILCGARRTGKTTIMYQIISSLLQDGVNPRDILFLSFDHPLLKLCSITQVIDVYRANVSNAASVFCFFDEIQYADNWDNWIKILYDTQPDFHLVATGSASPMLLDKASESGLGRWTIVHVPTLSFFEYCELLHIQVPDLPFDLKPTRLYLKSIIEQTQIFNQLAVLQVPFIRYLQVGGFPELALSADDVYAQRILREDIVDKALKRDIPAIYGIRNLSDLEKLFLYLCYTSSNIINVQTISKELDGVSRNTIEKYISYLESANLIYISHPIDIENKQLLKTQDKIYIADAAIRNAVLMKEDITNDARELGIIAETAVYKHVKAFYYDVMTNIGYYRGGREKKEIDIVVQSPRHDPIMIEVKYRDQAKIGETDAVVEKALQTQPNLVITKSANDFGEYSYGDKRIYRIPAPAFLYMLGLVEQRRKA